MFVFVFVTIITNAYKDLNDRLSQASMILHYVIYNPSYLLGTCNVDVTLVQQIIGDLKYLYDQWNMIYLLIHYQVVIVYLNNKY